MIKRVYLEFSGSTLQIFYGNTDRFDPLEAIKTTRDFQETESDVFFFFFKRNSLLTDNPSSFDFDSVWVKRNCGTWENAREIPLTSKEGATEIYYSHFPGTLASGQVQVYDFHVLIERYNNYVDLWLISLIFITIRLRFISCFREIYFRTAFVSKDREKIPIKLYRVELLMKCSINPFFYSMKLQQISFGRSLR